MLISVDPGTELDVFRDIVKIKEVVDVHLLFGEYDLIDRVEAVDYDAVGEIAGGPASDRYLVSLRQRP